MFYFDVAFSDFPAEAGLALREFCRDIFCGQAEFTVWRGASCWIVGFAPYGLSAEPLMKAFFQRLRSERLTARDYAEYYGFTVISEE